MCINEFVLPVEYCVGGEFSTAQTLEMCRLLRLGCGDHLRTGELTVGCMLGARMCDRIRHADLKTFV